MPISKQPSSVYLSSAVRLYCAGLLLFSVATVQAEPAVPATPLQQAQAWYWLHPYQPEAINRLALQWVQAGDADTAVILLQRALRIAPDRTDIRANLQRLQAGSRSVASVMAAQPASAASTPAGTITSPLPAIWPRRSPQ